MPIAQFKGVEFELDENGYLKDPGKWSKEVIDLKTYYPYI